jgi:hypothetical protein
LPDEPSVSLVVSQRKVGLTMSDRVLVHVLNEDPFVADLEAMPAANATYIYFTNPRTREGRPVAWNTGANKGFLFPLARVARIEFMVSDKDRWDLEFFARDDSKS